MCPLDGAASSTRHRAESDRVARLFHRGNAVLPDMPGFPSHDVERARLGIQGEALPFPAALAPEAEFAGRTKRQPEYFVKMRLVTMPSNSDTGIVFGAKNLFYLRSRAAIGFDFPDHRHQPFRHLLGFLKPPLGVVVFEAERSAARLRFVDGHHHSLRSRLLGEERNRAKNVPL